MNNKILLKDFFLFVDGTLPQTGKSIIESSQKVSSLKEALAKKMQAVKWAAALDEIIRKVDNLLEISLHDIMVSAWNKYRLFENAIEKSKASPNETFVIALAEHTIKSKHKPYIEIILNDKTIEKIDFDISLDLILKGFIVKIKNGWIKEITTGSCKGRGSLKCEGFMIIEEETKTFPLPGSIKLDEGI